MKIAKNEKHRQNSANIAAFLGCNFIKINAANKFAIILAIVIV